MRAPWLQFFDIARLAFESQHVIGMRMMRLAGGGSTAQREMQRMVVEKTAAMWKAQGIAASAMLAGSSADVAGDRVLRSYSTAVRANRRRLTRNR